MEALLASPGLEKLSEWAPILLGGFVNSIYIAIGGYTLGLVIGLMGAAGKLYGGLVARDLLEVYTTAVRAIPELILILLLYYAGSDLLNTVMRVFGYGEVDINGLAAGIVVIGIVQGAYTTEVIRGAILAVPVGQFEAGKAYGMGSFQIFHRITVPAMLPHALPGLGNLWLIATKDTALLAVVGFTELTLATRQAAGATKYYLTFYLAAGVLYLLLSIVSTIVIKLIESRYRRGMAGAAG